MPSLGEARQELAVQVYRYLLEPAGLTWGDVSWLVSRIPPFLLVLALFYLFARGLVWVLRRTLLSPRRVDPMIAHLTDRLISVLVLFVGFSVALLMFRVNIFSLALTLGLVGAALALGLQNTVANIMGGISLVNDRPFRVGDRVKIGEFWGDVEEIGLRSTRILTTRREYVIVPNRLMDEREIWNYTQRYPEIRIDVAVGISYDSDIDLARSVMLEAARHHAEVLDFPRSEVLVRGFEESAVHMELRCFLSDARRRYFIESDLYEAIKAGFDREGVEIPYPYRTIVEKADLPEPAHPTKEHPVRPAGPQVGRRRLLVATAGTTPALTKAQTIVDLAQRLDADLVVCYIVPQVSLVTQREGERAADIFSAAAKRKGVGVKLVVRQGVVVETIARVVREEDCAAVVIGAPRSPVLVAWKSANVEQRLRERLDVPVVVVPPSLEIDPDDVEAARRRLDQQAPPEEDGPA